MTAQRSVTAEVARLRRMTVPELAAKYHELYGKPARSRHREWLFKRVAWKVQEQRLGGLSNVAKARLEELIAEIELPLGQRARTIRARIVHDAVPPPGTVIVRRWRDRELRLTVREDGFEVDGRVYASLTAAATAVTGTKWNGRLFWLGSGR